MSLDPQPPSSRASSPGLAHFLILSDHEAEVLSLPSDPVTIGRDPDCDIVAQGVAVSRHHCRLHVQPNGWHAVTDLGSTWGVFVNGLRVHQSDLLPFDRLRVGDHEYLYLDPRTNPDDVLRVLLPRAGSSAPPSLSPPEELRGSLRERLMWLTLMFQELRSADELAPLLDALLDELFREPSCVRHAVVIVLDTSSVSGLRAVKLRDAPSDHVRVEALMPYAALVHEALANDVVLERSTPLGATTVCVPMRSHSRVSGSERRMFHPGSTRGALLLAAPGLRLNTEEKQLYRVLARQVAVLLSSVTLQRRATTDALTSLANRDHGAQVLRYELSEAVRAGSSVSVILLDLDDFKRVNDTHGHPAGDQVLRETARRLRRALRLTDTAARWGGEEFLVILPGASAEGAAGVAEKLLHELRSSSMGPQGLRITGSAGVATHPLDAGGLVPLLSGADEALYRAKEAGKDRVARYTPGLEGARPDQTQKFLTRATLPAPVAWLLSDQVGLVLLRIGRTTIGCDPSNDLCLPRAGVAQRQGVLTTSATGEVSYEAVGGVDPASSQPRRLELGENLTLGPYELTRIEDPGWDREFLGNPPCGEARKSALPAVSGCSPPAANARHGS